MRIGFVRTQKHLVQIQKQIVPYPHAQHPRMCTTALRYNHIILAMPCSETICLISLTQVISVTYIRNNVFNFIQTLLSLLIHWWLINAKFTMLTGYYLSRQYLHWDLSRLWVILLMFSSASLEAQRKNATINLGFLTLLSKINETIGNEKYLSHLEICWCRQTPISC